MNQPEYQRHWAEFSRRLKTRLENGHKSYGDKSFSLPIEQQIDEIQQELEDVCGWGLVMWGRLQRMKEQLPKNIPTRIPF